ncbi:MAG: hypothetical protein WCE44_14350 [Candidatus Velthaea sp.]|jgi:uncharacterized repeat protein (TIGR01451 family)
MRYHRLAAPIICSVLISLFGTNAIAKPVVALKLVGMLLEKDASGKSIAVPVESAQPKPGESIRYTVTASNTSGDVARTFVPQARIPAGTAYEPGSSVVAAPGHNEFSVDGGKTWSAKPMVAVKNADGTIVMKPADPASYTNIRWISGKDLSAHASASYTYVVDVK